MIEFRTGSIFDSGAQALVNPVNCHGVMGKGLAKEFDSKFPVTTSICKNIASRESLLMGKTYTISAKPADRGTAGIADKKFPLYIIHFPTKAHWSNKSDINDIVRGLRCLAHDLVVCNVKTVAIPALGCGLGGLDWKDVKPLMVEFHDYIQMWEVNVYAYEPQ
jgi:O-acetyl-ADP-ribose deacetylase (regulator of RNase III)